MTNRSLAILVAVAVVAGIGVAAYGLATKGSSKPARVLQIDEVNGRIGKVVLGETRENVIAAMGKPMFAKSLPGPSGTHLGLLDYPHLEIFLSEDQVTSIRTDDPDAQTEKVVTIGDPISAVRAAYRKTAKCIPNAPDKHDPHPRCTVKVPAGRLLVRGDPIDSMRLVRTG
jgi:hypothetical protein